MFLCNKLTEFLPERQHRAGISRPVLPYVYFGGYIAFPITSPMVSAASRIISGVAWV